LVLRISVNDDVCARLAISRAPLGLIGIVCLVIGVMFTVNGPVFAPGAHAQGFFERLFGVRPRSRPQRPNFQPREIRPSRSTPLWQPNGRLRGGNYGPESAPRASRRPARSAQRGRYRTLCVRMCDGYFFPVSFSARRQDLRRDAGVCSQRCPGQGKLFYVPSPRGELDDARAQDGQLYRKLDTAFLYRKTRVKNCACRPAPWEHSERLRHAMYSSNPGAPGEPQVIAGNYDRPKKSKTDDSTRQAKADQEKSETVEAKTDLASKPDTDPVTDETQAETNAGVGPDIVNTASADDERSNPGSEAQRTDETGTTEAATAEPPTRQVTRSAPTAQHANTDRSPRTRQRRQRTERQMREPAPSRSRRARDIQRTRRAGIFPFLSSGRSRQLRFPGD
jgi:hypothetical protein